MNVHRVRNLKEFETHWQRSGPAREAQAAAIRQPPYRGFSYAAGCMVEFGTHSPVNWREQLHCPHSGLNNRSRAAVQLLDWELNCYPDSDIYLSEQTTPLYQYLRGRFPGLIGSEFLGDAVPRGASNAQGLRNEDMCALSFDDASLDAILSFDVLEHIPNFQQAFAECARCLRAGGHLMWSVPFLPGSTENLVRAVVEQGRVRHLLEPEYHGDPLSPNGVLCYTHFGWEMLAQACEAGFSDAYAIVYDGLEFGYLGDEGQVFVAVR